MNEKSIVVDLSEIVLGDIPNLIVEWVCLCGYENQTQSGFEIFVCEACGRKFQPKLESKLILEKYQEEK